ncbi:hypothetical protein SDC9_139531 [bioreactor metagenome]|uniref:Uncharacterized protein n=1 Tax=bioreactor metagenome TaxID=1076179 RepID=A0A645DSU3_9ZZZZ
MQRFGHCFAKIQSFTVVIAFHVEVKLHGYLLERVKLSFGYYTVRPQILEHHVAPLQTVFRIQLGVVSGGCFEESHKCSSLFVGYVFGCGVEIGFTGRFYAVSIAAEVDRIEIHRQNFLFAVKHFNFHGGDPLFRLHDNQFHSGDEAQRSGRIL